MSCNESSDNIKQVITANALYKQTLADKPITTSTLTPIGQLNLLKKIKIQL